MSSVATTLVSLSLILTVALGQQQLLQQDNLIKDPPGDTVQISQDKPGLKLACRDDSGSSQGVVKWFTLASDDGGDDDKEETEVDPKFVSVNKTGFSVLSMGENDAREGVFRCTIDGTDHSRQWTVEPHFSLEKLPHSETVVEGEDLKIRCKLRPNAASSGQLTFTWYKVPEEDELAEGAVIDNATSLPHLGIYTIDAEMSVLKIEDAVYEDRSFYRCVARLTGGERNHNRTMQTLVRVKDKYAALYPFIGIVCEVIALSLIIFICERRKSAQQDEEDDEEPEGGAAAPTAGNGNSNLRQRRS